MNVENKSKVKIILQHRWIGHGKFVIDMLMCFYYSALFSFFVTYNKVCTVFLILNDRVGTTENVGREIAWVTMGYQPGVL